MFAEKIRDANTFCLQELRNGGQGNVLSYIRSISECLQELGLTDVFTKMIYASIENYLEDICTELASDLSLSIIDEVSHHEFSLIAEHLDAIVSTIKKCIALCILQCLVLTPL